jgi:hypothetical protein
LLRFEVHEVYLETMGRYLLPLPKLSGAQLEFLARHLGKHGFSVGAGPRISARRGQSRISIDRVGLAWSSEELLDAVAPAVPGLLKLSREATPTNPYFEAKKTKDGFAVRLVTRMESSSLWVGLRGSGQCGLTPDEGLVIRELLRDTEGEVECVADYPTEGCSPLRVGRHPYYESRVPIGEFVANLRTVSSPPRKNCYLPKQSTLHLRTESRSLGGLPEDLGEWCFLMPKRL